MKPEPVFSPKPARIFIPSPYFPGLRMKPGQIRTFFSPKQEKFKKYR